MTMSKIYTTLHNLAFNGLVLSLTPCVAALPASRRCTRLFRLLLRKNLGLLVLLSFSCFSLGGVNKHGRFEGQMWFMGLV